MGDWGVIKASSFLRVFFFLFQLGFLIIEIIFRPVSELRQVRLSQSLLGFLFNKVYQTHFLARSTRFVVTL